MKPTSGISAVAFAVLAFASTAALAENSTGFYLGGGLGYAGQTIDCEGISNCSKSHVGFKLMGGYQVMPNLAIEASYGDTGRTKVSEDGRDASLKTHSFTVAALGIFPVTKEVELFGKLGVHSTRTRFNTNFTNPSVSESFNASGLLAGVGAQYRFTSNLVGRVEYERLNRAVRLDDERADINLLTASVLYQF
jgi:opacity protein-like surface antigen